MAGVKKGAKGAVEIKTYDKVKALKLLGRHLGISEKPKASDDSEEVQIIYSGFISQGFAQNA